MAVDRRLLQESIREGRGGSDRQPPRHRCVAADVERSAVPAGLLHAPFTDWDKAIRFDDARDGSAWSAANARFNDFFREIVTRFEFEDALLLDTRGNVVYSAYKGVDLGTNILTGPYREGGLTEAYQKALASNTVDYVGITDFGDYQPADEPTAWMVSPVGTQTGGRCSGPAVPDLQDQPADDGGQAMEVRREWARPVRRFWSGRTT